MNDEELSSLFSNIDKQAVDENAKKSAINLAMAEFTAAQSEQKKNKNFFQGLLSRLRLIPSSQDDNGRENMSIANKKFILGGAAGALVSAFAFTVFVYNPSAIQVEDDSLLVEPEPEVVSELGDDSPSLSTGQLANSAAAPKKKQEQKAPQDNIALQEQEAPLP